MKRVHLFIDGRVQGVFFRAETQRAAKALRLAGWVRNLEDGRVEVVIEGEDAHVDKMIAWCKTGPSAARVDRVEVIEEPYKGNLESFRISYFER
ncbi:MAG: acylphosphatase [Deltaproteobacteria bacterium]|nr:acylphosphatase [Deltaproteobacteria bacterium]